MNICVFGDSIAWGAYDPEYGGWVNHLQSYFESLDHFIYNLGVPGDLTTDLLVRLEDEAKCREADVIIFAIGINDVRLISSASSDYTPDIHFRSNIEKLYEKAKKITSKIIFVGLNSVDETKIKLVLRGSGKAYINENIKRLDQIIKKFCLEKNLIFIPMSNLLNSDDFFDGLHPNTQGHNKIFEIMKLEIESVIKGQRL